MLAVALTIMTGVAANVLSANLAFADQTAPFACNETNFQSSECKTCLENPASTDKSCAQVPASNSGPAACQADPQSSACKTCMNTTDSTDPACAKGSTDTSDNCDPSKDKSCCGTVKTSIIGKEICGTGGDNKTAETSTIWKLLMLILKIMTAGIGIAAVGGIVYGALLYTTAEDKPEQTKKAIGVITNVVIGLVAYGLMYVLLNFLIPGGIFK